MATRTVRPGTRSQRRFSNGVTKGRESISVLRFGQPDAKSIKARRGQVHGATRPFASSEISPTFVVEGAEMPR